MSKNLLIVESPAKSRTIAKYLGKDFIVKASMGHVMDLPEREFGIDIKDHFKPKYVALHGKSKIIKEIQEAAAKSECVFLGPDPDREGEAIAWHISSILDDKTKVKRVLFNEITKNAVIKAIDTPREIDLRLVNAQQARRILDRIVGYQVSPILWRALYSGLSAGRVQSVALRLICERGEEIKSFKPEEYWSLEVDLSTKDQQIVKAKLHSIKGSKAHLPDQAATDKVMAAVTGKEFHVSSLTTKEKIRQPSPPFITSTLQQEAARRLYFSAAKTMMVAQQLYEGLEVGADRVGLITYMRTDSTRISEDAREAARTWIRTVHGSEYVPEKPKEYKKSKSAQDAHEAIRPTYLSEEYSPAQVKSYLNKEQLRLYELIWKRFIASQMTNAVFDATVVDIATDGHIFRATGSVEKFAGFKKEYEEVKEETEKEEEQTKLPVLKEGERLDFVSWSPLQHFTQPPPAFTESMLVRELESKGIGRPSTYAQIIDTLKRRKYVRVDNRRFTPSEIGETVNKILVQEFPEIFEIGFTAHMEELLDRIESGGEEWLHVLDEFYKSFSKTLSGAREQIKDLKESLREDTGEKCEKCGKPMIIKWGRNGRFVACSGYPDCTNTKPLGENPEDARIQAEKCPQCGSGLKVRYTRTGRFIGCSGYPKCKYVRSITTGIPCPEPGCTGELVERRTKRGRLFYGCARYPNCKFATWDKPAKGTCAACNNPYLVEKSNKKSGTFLICPKCKTPAQGGEGESVPPA